MSTATRTTTSSPTSSASSAVHHQVGDVQDTRSPPPRRRLLAAPALLSLAALAIKPAAAAASEPDAALLRLGQRFEAAWKAETAAWDAAGTHDDDHQLSRRAVELNDVTAAIVHEIEHVPATTSQELLVKGRAVRWCCSHKPPTADIFGWSPLQPQRQLATNERVILSLLKDLHAMTGDAA